MLNQVTLMLKTVAEMSETPNFNQKSERSLSEVMSEVLSKKEFVKVQDIIKYIEENGEITPEIARQISGKSVATTRRYMKLLMDTGYIKSQGSTNNLVYIVSNE